jgi:protein involved in polysaccharide export with SLBB domain
VLSVEAGAQEERRVSQTAAERASLGRPHPGDQVDVKVWREPALSDRALINERGEVILPKIGVIDIAGHTIASLQDTIRARFARYLVDPGIDITVLRRVAVNGEVARPDVYYLDASTTVREAIARAGGITASGHSGAVSLIRDGTSHRIRNWQQDDSFSSDLRSGDQIVVSRRHWMAQNAIPLASAVGVLAAVLIPLFK